MTNVCKIMCKRIKLMYNTVDFERSHFGIWFNRILQNYNMII